MTFLEWLRQWCKLRSFKGSYVPDIDQRIARIVTMLAEPVPEGWKRTAEDIPERYSDAPNGYRRSDNTGGNPGEHQIEHAVLTNLSSVHLKPQCSLVCGWNAFPLVTSPGQGRSGNVEVDLLLLVNVAGQISLRVTEWKITDHNPWFAAVTNLLQASVVT
jgi:hypothetical protein